MDKKKLSLAGFGALAAAVIVIISVIAFGGKGGKTDSSRADSSMPAVTVTASSAAETGASVAEVSASEASQTSAEAREDSSAADALSSAAERIFTRCCAWSRRALHRRTSATPSS